MRFTPFAVALTLALAPLAAFADDLEALARAIDEHPEDAKAYDAYARAAISAKRFDDAIRRLKVGVARIADYSEGYYKLAYAYRQKKEWADAADYYRRYIALNPSKSDPYFGLGASLAGLGDTKGAVAAYDRYVALEKSPQKQRFIDQARAEAAKLDPSRTPPGAGAPAGSPGGAPTPAAPAAPPTAGTAPAARGEAPQLRAAAERLRGEGKLDEAVAAYEKAIAADRGNIELYNDLGNVHFGLKRYGEAARAFEEATRRDGNYALGWYNLAHALRKADRKGEAVSAYRQYIKLRPEDPDPYYGLGQTLKGMGDVRGAIDAFRRYISMEKRPDEQRWVDKARTELEALESMDPGGPGRPRPSGRAAPPSGSEERPMPRAAARSRELDRELERDGLLPLSGDLYDPFAGEPPLPASARLRDLKDPFRDDAPVAPRRYGRSQGRRLAEYGVALAAYRRALARHLEELTVQYERGVAYLLADDAAAAQRTWDQVGLADVSLDDARRAVERLRATVAAQR
jgi:tetratricopeptide (TPR) repeat protein